MNIQNPIYITAVGIDGKMILGGIFKMQDQVGFPVDASFEESRQHGFVIDWLEALCDCWLNDCLKYDSFCRQASNCCGVNLDAKFQEAGAVVLALFPKIKHTQNPVDVFCKYILQKKKNRSWDLVQKTLNRR